MSKRKPRRRPETCSWLRCHNLFIPKREGHNYCSSQCRASVNAGRYYDRHFRKEYEPRSCASDRCDNVFAPVRVDSRFCSKRCLQWQHEQDNRQERVDARRVQKQIARLSVMEEWGKQECAHGSCTNTFFPTRKDRQFCSDKCGWLAYDIDNREWRAEVGRQRYAENAEEYRRRGREDYWANREQRIASRREWRKNNPGKARANRRAYRNRKKNAPSIPYTKEQEQQRMMVGGNRCVNCGTQEDMTTDHIIPLSANGWDCLSNLQPMCRSCNSSKQDRWPWPPLEEKLERMRALPAYGGRRSEERAA